MQEGGEKQKQVTWGKLRDLKTALIVPSGSSHLEAEMLTFSSASELFHKGTEHLRVQQPIFLFFCHLES